jgi:hypothetical protein
MVAGLDQGVATVQDTKVPNGLLLSHFERILSQK